ncbi:MAG: transporter suffix domain-containing protein [Eubacteriaceae bacterium]|nr:transporter suffix domain-containing protein [Eubacteriaceae bacterium]
MPENKSKKPILFKIGIVLLILSSVLWLTPLLVPFTSLSVYTKAVIISSTLICAEVMFWISVLLLGKEAVKKYRNRLNPRNWRKKSNTIKNEDNDIDNI